MQEQIAEVFLTLQIRLRLCLLNYELLRERKVLHLTRLRHAGSNTAPSVIGQTNEAEAHVPALQDAAREKARIPCAQPHGKGPRRPAREARQGPQAPRRVGPRPGCS